MKLKTRIIWISCLTVLAAAMISELLIGIFMWENLREKALEEKAEESFRMVEKIETDLAQNPGTEVDEIYMDYILKSYGDDYNICYLTENQELWEREDRPAEADVREAYNRTIFSYGDLLQIKYQQYHRNIDTIYMTQQMASVSDYGYLNYQGRNYVVFRFQLEGYIWLYRIQDITYVKEQMVEIAIVMAGITALVITVAIILLRILLGSALKPLRQLGDTAKSMAAGIYDTRVALKRKDEIGALGESFNQMAEAVEQRTRSLEESEQKKTIFMGNLTHELKTPMTAISGYAQTLLSAKLSEEDQQAALQYIYEECGRLERLSKKMMNLLELGQEDGVEIKDTAVKTLFQAAYKSCKELLRKKQITLRCIENGEHFAMDIDLMTDVLVNLIDNAVKASAPGGEIILRAQGRCIEVQDFGTGIPKEEQEKILEPFYMIDKSRSRKSGGAGLGLALIAVIVKKHNIQMTIDSTPGEGSRFVLEFEE